MESKKDHQETQLSTSTKTQQPSTHSSSNTTTASSSSSFSWLNFQTIHILVEVVTICGISYYFNRKLNTLTKQIEDLLLRLDDQEKIIQNHDDVLKKLISNYTYRQQQQQLVTTPPAPYTNSPPSQTSSSSANCVGGVCPITLPNNNKNKQNEEVQIQRILTPPVDSNTTSKDPVKFGESLDDELQEELSELDKSKQ
jgi:hypothetical protein